MNKTKKIFYFGMVNSEKYARGMNSEIEIGAGSIKMIAVIKSLRDAGQIASLVSMPVLGRNNSVRYLPKRIIRDQGAAHYFFPTLANPYFRKILGLIFFSSFAFSKINKNDTVIIYNHSFEYIAALLILRIRRIKTFLDIEDMPRADIKNFLSQIDRFIFGIFLKYTDNRKIVVSSQIAKKLKINSYFILYGCAKNQIMLNKPKVSLNSPELTILYSGTLIAETGLNLFCDTITILRKEEFQKKINNKITFLISGFGGEDKISLINKECHNSNIFIEYYSYLSPSNYRELIVRSDVGLCLKLPKNEITQTTFPSKVIEITTNGLLLLTTAASDIPSLFTDKEAVILKDTTPEYLANIIIEINDNKNIYKSISLKGYYKALKNFDSKEIGYKLSNFLFH